MIDDLRVEEQDKRRIKREGRDYGDAWPFDRQQVVDAYAVVEDPTRPQITSLHRHKGCGHDCLSTACLPITNKMDPKCLYCQLVEPDRRWSDGRQKF